MVDAEIRRLSRHLEALLRLKKIPIRALERQLGFGGGTMNRIFSGKIELKVRHILLILETLDIEPARFFRHVYAEPDKPLTDEQVLATVDRMNRRRPGEEGERNVEPTIPLSELQAVVVQVLEKYGLEPDNVFKAKRKKTDAEEGEDQAGAEKEEPPPKPKGKKGAKKKPKKSTARKPPADADGPPESR